MPQEVYVLEGFNRERTEEKLHEAIEHGSVRGDMSDEITEETKGVMSLWIKVNSDLVSFQISPFGKLIISSSDNSKLRKARSKLHSLIICSEWVPKSFEPAGARAYGRDAQFQRGSKARARHSDIYIYKNQTDRDLVLNHSRNVASGLQFLISASYQSRVGVEETLLPNVKYKEHALKHLMTAPKFRMIYDKFKEAEKAGEEAVEEEKRSIGAIKSGLLSTKLKLKHEENIVEIVAMEVCEDIKRVLEGHEPIFLNNLKVIDGKTKSGVNTLTLAEEFEPLRRFIMREEESKENKSACKRILDLKNKYCTSQADFKRLAEQLIMQVINGTPLDGKCDICPKVTTLQNEEDNKVLH